MPLLYKLGEETQFEGRKGGILEKNRESPLRKQLSGKVPLDGRKQGEMLKLRLGERKRPMFPAHCGIPYCLETLIMLAKKAGR